MTGKTLILGAGIVIGAVVLYTQRGASRAAVTEPQAVTPAVHITGANATPHVWRPSRSTPEELPVAVGKRDAIAEPPPARDPERAQPKRGETLIEQFAPLHEALELAFVLESLARHSI